MYKAIKNGFIRDGSNEVENFIEIGATSFNQDWVKKQEASIKEYLAHMSVTPNEIQNLYFLFDGYISRAIAGRSGLNILDVGCGIRKEWPHYARSIEQFQGLTGNIYLGLDPLPFNLEDRAYPLIVGKIEDVYKNIQTSFDVFIFSTSLDHFEDLSDVASALKKIAKPNAILIIWTGLHDPSLVAEQIGSSIYRRLYASLNPIIFVYRAIKALISIPFNYLRLLQRRIQLKINKPLDNLHFHYFTERSIHSEMKAFGEVESYLQIPGTNSAFMVVRLKS